MKLIHDLRKIKKGLSYRKPLIKIMVSKKNILDNFEEYKRHVPSGMKISPVLKSNAYGHGIKEVASMFKNKDNPFLVIESLFEAETLRSYGISDKILLIGYFRPKMINHKIKNTSYLVTSLEQLYQIQKIIKQKALIHLKIDTGMRRQGISIKDVSKAIKIIKSSKKIILEGVCSHLSDADNKDESFTLKQIKAWNPLVDKFKKEFNNKIKYFHLSASSGIGYLKNISSNLLRLGIGLYGFNQSQRLNLNLKPALRAETIITTIRNLLPSDSIGYSATFKPQKPLKVATMPFGYYEGLDRRLSNKGLVKCKNEFCRVLGRVSMNITSFDVTKIKNTKIGEKVVAISDNPEDKNSVLNISKICETIPYVILVNIPAHLRRIVY